MHTEDGIQFLQMETQPAVPGDGRRSRIDRISLFRLRHMDTSTVITLTGTFLKAVGQVVSDLKRSCNAVELLDLKRKYLDELLEDFEARLGAAVKQEKARSRHSAYSECLPARR